jgi:hypothetical protein
VLIVCSKIFNAKSTVFVQHSAFIRLGQYLQQTAIIFRNNSNQITFVTEKPRTAHVVQAHGVLPENYPLSLCYGSE